MVYEKTFLILKRSLRKTLRPLRLEILHALPIPQLMQKDHLFNLRKILCS